MRIFRLSLLPTVWGFLLSNVQGFATSESQYVSSKFKAPNEKTPPNIVTQWANEDKTLWKFVEENVPAVLAHTGSASFDHHLRGVQAVLRYFGAPAYLASAGLFHSIYGTEGFQGFSLPLKERENVRSIIGAKAEQLCFWFCMVDRSTVDQTVLDWSGPVDADTTFHFRARPELGRFDIVLDKEQWLDFVELTLTDWLEQVEGAATKSNDLFLWETGQAYAYRRLAYKKMSHILSIERSSRLSVIPKQMLEEVMGTEPAETRNLVQARTPPMSEASARAWEVLRIIGEDIPEVFSPQPVAIEEQVCS